MNTEHKRLLLTVLGLACIMYFMLPPLLTFCLALLLAGGGVAAYNWLCSGSVWTAKPPESRLKYGWNLFK